MGQENILGSCVLDRLEWGSVEESVVVRTGDEEDIGKNFSCMDIKKRLDLRNMAEGKGSGFGCGQDVGRRREESKVMRGFGLSDG